MVDVLDYYFIMPKSTMWNLPYLFRMKPEIDVTRMAEAIDKVLSCHPVFSTRIFIDENGNFVQKYIPESYEKIEIEKLTDDEFQSKIDSLSYPFMIVNAPLHRKKIYITEKANYFFIYN